MGWLCASQPGGASAWHPIEIAGWYLTPERAAFKLVAQSQTPRVDNPERSALQSIRFQSRLGDHFRPFGDLAPDELSELFRRGRNGLGSDRAHPLPEDRIPESAHDRLVQFRNYLPRRASRGDDAEPAHGLVARQSGLGEGRDFGQRRIALERGHS